MQVFEYYRQLEGYFGWTEEDARRVQLLGPLLRPYFDGLVDDLYAQIECQQQTVRECLDGQQQFALKQTLHSWLIELFSGQYDEQYVALRWNFGRRHVELGLDRLLTSAALLRFRRRLLDSLAVAWNGEPSAQIEGRNSLNTLLDLNRAIIEHAYQSEYERRQATAERLVTIGVVAGSIVEELRGPLDAAKDAIESLCALPDAERAVQRVQLVCLDRQVCRVEAVVSALNDFVRLPLKEFQPVEIVQCLREAFDAHDLPDSVRLRWDLPVASLKVLGDPAQLRIVLSNLIRSAQDALHTGGWLQIGASAESDLVCVTIQHSAACHCQTSRATARAAVDGRKPRIGLGLSILHDIVGRHRGALLITTEETTGTTATLRLPMHR